MKETASIKINNREYTFSAEKDKSLLALLREDLGLTGAKKGCGKGVCGTCTVILDGKPVRSCRVKALEAAGSRIETIEGLSDSRSIHAVQYAFIVQGAVQCGFCTPGMIMSVKALLDKTPDPSEGEIRNALKANLCRCTGYQPIFKAVRTAAELIRKGQIRILKSEVRLVPEGENRAVGSEIRDTVILDKVTGTLAYAQDGSSRDDSLKGAILFSPHPSGLFTLDTSEAEALEGVVLVLTARDVPGINSLGMILPDQPALAEGRVKCVADPLAAVFARTEEQARKGAARIKINFTPLPGVFSSREALSREAPRIHENGNLCHEALLSRGDPDEAFRVAAAVVEQVYTTSVIDPGFMEPESGLAWMDKEGRVVVEMGTQCAFDDRRQLAAALALSPEQVVVRQLPMGGAFGGKEDISLQFILALGAIKTGKKVRITLTREESFRVHPKRHPVIMKYKTAANARGNLIAVKADILADTGAYASLGPDILENMLTFGAGPYEVPHLEIRGRLVYTNNPPSGAVRGFGVPQSAFAVEQQMDRLAGILGMDSLEIRKKNALVPGKLLASGQKMEAGTAVLETMEEIGKVLKGYVKPENTEKWQYGLGLASAMKNVGFGHGITEEAGAVLVLEEDRIRMRCGTFEYGQGSLTALKQLAAEVLGADFRDLFLGLTETVRSPETGATTASRQTFLTGNAVIGAAEQLKETVIAQAVRELGGQPDEWSIRGSRVENPLKGESLSLFSPRFSGLESSFTYRAPKTRAFPVPGAVENLEKPEGILRTHWAYSCTTQAALVRVDRQSGQIEVLKMWAALDCGKALNPLNVRGQIEGGVVQGMGFALSEEVVYEQGMLKTENFHQYRMPRASAVPEIVSILVEVPDPNGPFGAKGIGEIPILAAAPAIVSAVQDAAGVWYSSLPLMSRIAGESSQDSALFTYKVWEG